MGLLKLVGSVGPIFGAFVYYVGRQYVEAYYQALGVSPELLDLDFADYMYFGVRSWAIIIAIALTILAVFLWNLYRLRDELNEREQAIKPIQEQSIRGRFIGIWKVIASTFRPKKGDPQYLLVGFFIYWVIAVVMSLLWILPMAETNLFVEAGIQIMMLSSAVFLAFLLVTDRPTIEFFVGRRYLYRYFMAGTLFFIVVSAQILPHSWGMFKGFYDGAPYRAQHIFPTVSLTANHHIGPPSLRWELKDDGLLTTDEPLLLLIATDKYLILRYMDARLDAFLVPAQAVVGIEIRIPGRSYGAEPD